LLAAESVEPDSETYGDQQRGAKSQNLQVFRESVAAQQSLVLREAWRTARQVLEHSFTLNSLARFPGNGLQRFLSWASGSIGIRETGAKDTRCRGNKLCFPLTRKPFWC
jgi:hypothetical protein